MGVLLFLPLMTKKWSRYVLIGPYVLFNLVTDYQYMHSIYFHYVFGSGLLLIYLVIINLSDIDVKKRLGLIYSVVAAVTIFFTAYNLPKLETAVDTWMRKDSRCTVLLMRDFLLYLTMQV